MTYLFQRHRLEPSFLHCNDTIIEAKIQTCEVHLPPDLMQCNSAYELRRDLVTDPYQRKSHSRSNRSHYIHPHTYECRSREKITGRTSSFNLCFVLCSEKLEIKYQLGSKWRKPSVRNSLSFNFLTKMSILIMLISAAQKYLTI